MMISMRLLQPCIAKHWVCNCELVNLCVRVMSYLVLWRRWFCHVHVPSFGLAVCCPPRATVRGPASAETKVVFHWLRLHWVVLLQVTALNKESPPGVGSRVAQVCLQVSRFTYPFW